MNPLFEKLIEASEKLNLRAIKSLEDAGMTDELNKHKKFYLLGTNFRKKQRDYYKKHGVSDVEWQLEKCGTMDRFVHSISPTIKIELWDYNGEGVNGVYSTENTRGFSFYLPGLNLEEAKQVVLTHVKSFLE